jgi:two-component system chemotaxis response regulator CheB
MRKPLRVLVVDDSLLVRKAVVSILHADANITVVGTAANGWEALEKVAVARPDVVMLDIGMPKLDGLQTLSHLLRERPIPVVMLSTMTAAHAEKTMEALRLGAVDFVGKPPGSLGENVQYLKKNVLAKVKAAGAANLQSACHPQTDDASGGCKPESQAVSPRRQGPRPGSPQKAALIAIGCSTGGPHALMKILPVLPKYFPGAIGIVQHMPEPFTEVFVKQLARESRVAVKMAETGDPFRPGQVLMAPGDANLQVVRGNDQVFALLERPRSKPRDWMPSVDVFFTSAARARGEGTVGILLTGIGRDGVKGMAAIKRRGGITIAQDEASAIVFGMPKAAIESGSVDLVVSLEQVPTLMVKYACTRNV